MELRSLLHLKKTHKNLKRYVLVMTKTVARYSPTIEIAFRCVLIPYFNIQHALKEKGLEDAIEKARQENPFPSQPGRAS